MASNENKLKHLEFVQTVVTRMASNSFLLKAWSVTLVAALFALAAKDSNQNYVLVAYIPLVVFWGLDAYYLKQERRFRQLYDDVAARNESAIDFSMKAPASHHVIRLWLEALASITLLLFYVPLIVLTVIISMAVK